MVSNLHRQPAPRAGLRAAGIRFAWLVVLGLLALAVAGAWFFTHRPLPPEPATADLAAAESPAASPAIHSPNLHVLPEAASNPVADLIAQLLNPALDERSRRRAARALARLNSDDAIAALRTALQNGSSALQAGIAECLGESTHPQARAMLLDLIDAPDEAVACGAIRGFASRGDAEAADLLGNLLFNAKKTEGIRTEAALALGEVSDPNALATLTRAATEIHDETIPNRS